MTVKRTSTVTVVAVATSKQHPPQNAISPHHRFTHQAQS